MDDEIANCPWMLEKIRSRNDYAQNLYAAMCNMRWIKLDVIPILREDYWSASWRGAGGIIAQFRKQGDYMDWYCSGMGGLATYNLEEGEAYMDKMKYVPEGSVTQEIREDLNKLGWAPSEWPKD